jgi:hypothetical protein
MKKIILLSNVLLIAAVCAKAQDIGQIISGSTADANKYLNYYLEPFGKGEIMNMGRGWFSSAKTHKRLGFDITVNAQVAIIPDAKQSFLFNTAEYSTFKLKSGASSATVPTFAGNNSFQTLSVNTTVNGKNVSYEFNTPTGVGADIKNAVGFVAVPLPVAQVGIGLFKNTDLKVRYFPKTNFGDVGVGVFGLAVQHEFGLPVVGKVPIFHFSALAGYNSVNVQYNLKNSTISGTNQRAEINLSGFTVQGIASLKLLIFELYAALGYTTGTADASLKGTYTINYKDNSTTPATTFSNTVTDPIALSYKNSGITNTYGLRMNLFLFKIFADYTFANYNGAGAGIIFSFR